MRSLLSRFEIRPGEHRPHPLRDGLILLTVLGTLLFAGYTRHIPFTHPSGQVVRAHLTTASNVRAHQPVRVKGVDVGEVEKVRLAPDGRSAIVTLRIDPDSGISVRRDAAVAVWWRTLLGFNQYVELDPGSPSAPALGDQVIPPSRTSVQTEVDEVLRTLDDDGRGAVRTVVKELDRGFGDGTAVRGTVDRLGPATRGLGKTVTALRGTRPGTDLPRLARSANRALGAIAADETQLAGLVDHADTALAVTAARRADLGASVAGAPAAMRQTRSTLARLESTLDVLDPLVRRLQPGAEVLEPAAVRTRAALRQAIPLLDDARPLLRRLRPALRTLEPLAGDGTELMDTLQPSLTRAHEDIVPWLQRRDPDTKLLNGQAIGPTFSALSDASSLFDANGSWIRFETAPAERAINTLPCVLNLTNPDTQDKIDCTRLTQALQTALGGRPATTTRKARR